jgi:peptide deformylase
MLEIVQVGDPVLRAEAAPVADVTELAELIGQMRDTMRLAPGVGLAAPQIGKSLQLAVIEDTVEDLARDRAPVPFHVIANPTLAFVGDEMVEAYEGCLSFKGFVMKVKRARHVRVEALDEHGNSRVIEASGWYARILQHEIDHLRGIVCCDRMDSRTLSTVDNIAKQAAPAGPRG